MKSSLVCAFLVLALAVPSFGIKCYINLSLEEKDSFWLADCGTIGGDSPLTKCVQYSYDNQTYANCADQVTCEEIEQLYDGGQCCGTDGCNKPNGTIVPTVSCFQTQDGGDIVSAMCPPTLFCVTTTFACNNSTKCTDAENAQGTIKPQYSCGNDEACALYGQYYPNTACCNEDNCNDPANLVCYSGEGITKNTICKSGEQCNTDSDEYGCIADASCKSGNNATSTCCDQSGCNNPNKPLECYQGIGAYITLAPCPALIYDSCLYAKGVCQEGDDQCPGDVGQTIEIYYCLPSSMCANYTHYPGVETAFCCNTPGCNAPPTTSSSGDSTSSSSSGSSSSSSSSSSSGSSTSTGSSETDQSSANGLKLSVLVMVAAFLVELLVL